MQIVSLCEAAGVSLSVDTCPFTLVGGTAAGHLAAVIPTAYLVDCEGHVSFLETLAGILSGGVSFEGAEVVVLDAAGLGVEVDWTALAEHGAAAP